MRAVIRACSFRSAMLGLASLAVLLLVLVPGLGRLAGSRAPAGGWEHAGAHWTAICTVAGLRYVQLPGTADGAGPAGDADAPGASPGHDGADCDYCPLLASLLLLALCLALCPPFRRPPSAGPRHADSRREWRHPCGLGSRGPPLAL